jgi:hypothetical protein
LTTVRIPNSCTRIADGAFIVSSLRHIVIPGGCRISNWAFQHCRSLWTVTVQTGGATIEIGAFAGCAALTTVTLPSTLKSIGDYTFGDCPALRDDRVPEAMSSPRGRIPWEQDAGDGIVSRGVAADPGRMGFLRDQRSLGYCLLC